VRGTHDRRDTGIQHLAIAAALMKARLALGVSPSLVRWFAQADSEPSAEWKDHPRVFWDSDPLLGACPTQGWRVETYGIKVKNGLSPEETARVLLHELRHLWQVSSGMPADCDRAWAESDAWAFANEVMTSFPSRQLSVEDTR
jgi:hypothetical protein